MVSADLWHVQINVAYNTVEAEITSGKYQPDDQQPLPRKDIMSLVPDVWPEPPLFGNLHIYVSLPDMGSPILNVGECFIPLFALAQNI